METPETPDPANETTGDETPEEYKEQVENDPSQNPQDEELERLRGG